MKIRVMALALVAALVVASAAPVVRADPTAEQIRAVSAKVTPSLVIVSFYVELDNGQRVDGRVLGEVVGPKNLIMMTSLAISDRVPIGQYHNFEIIVVKGSELQTYAAEYLGKDDVARVAFLRIKDSAAPTLPPIVFDEGSKVELGDPVVSFSNLGEPDTYRALSQMLRVTGIIDLPYTLYLVTGLGVQGTPVITLDGKLVGIVGKHEMNVATNAKPQKGQADVIWPVERFIARVKNPPEGGQQVKRPWLGVSTLNPVTKDLATVLGLGDKRGVVVGQVIEDTPAAKAGLKAEDIILAMNDKPLSGAEGQLVESFMNALKERKIGEEVTLDIFREGKTQKIKVTLAEQPQTEAEAKRYKNKEFGLTIRELVLADTIARELPNNEKGVIASFVEPAGWAQEGGIAVGDIIKKVQDKDVANAEQFQKVFEEEIAKKPKEVVLFVLRGKKETKLIRIEPRWDGEKKSAESDKKAESEKKAEPTEKK